MRAFYITNKKRMFCVRQAESLLFFYTQDRAEAWYFYFFTRDPSGRNRILFSKI